MSRSSVLKPGESFTKTRTTSGEFALCLRDLVVVTVADRKFARRWAGVTRTESLWEKQAKIWPSRAGTARVRNPCPPLPRPPRRNRCHCQGRPTLVFVEVNAARRASSATGPMPLLGGSGVTSLRRNEYSCSIIYRIVRAVSRGLLASMVVTLRSKCFKMLSRHVETSRSLTP